MEIKVSGLTVLIDDEDWPRIKDYPLYLSTGSDNLHTYVYLKVNGKNIRLHRFLTNAPDELVVDHNNRNTLDNRKDNLEPCTHSRNLQNQNKRILKKLPQGVSKSDYGFRARIQISKGVNKFLGTFKTPEEAGQAYAIAAKLRNVNWSETE